VADSERNFLRQIVLAGILLAASISIDPIALVSGVILIDSIKARSWINCALIARLDNRRHPWRWRVLGSDAAHRPFIAARLS